MGARLYCTYCDHRYLPRAIALYHSMIGHGFQGEFWLFCLSKECSRILSQMNLPRMRVVALSELETAYPELLAIKPQRETIEYYYTCSPFILDYAFAKRPDAEWVTFLDSDLWFFDSPDRVFDEIGEAPVAIIAHNFAPRMRAQERFGVYNVGWVTFRRNEEGMRCLDWWRASCVDWCFGFIDGDRYADQRYLDRFAQIAPNTFVIAHKGCNLAPWNIANYTITVRDGVIFADDDPLIFFHFHGIRKAWHFFYFDNHRRYRAPHSQLIRDQLYKPYIEALLQAEHELEGAEGEAGGKSVNPRGAYFAGIDFKNVSRRALRTAYQLADVIDGRPIIVLNSRVI